MVEPSPSPSALDIRLFGPAAVTLAGRPPEPVLAKKGLWLLALLALRHERRVERDWLAGTLWPESMQSQALDNMRHSLTDLRKALGEEADRLHSPTLSTLCLDLSGVCVDMLEFDAAVTRGDTVSLEQAVAVYRGPLLEGCTEEWVLPEREAREQAYLAALETLARHGIERQEFAEAISRLRRVVSLDPLRESAQRALMQALASAGNFAAAVQVYRDLRLLLRRELNAEPDPQTLALFEQLRGEARRRAQTKPTALSPLSSSPPPRRLPRPLTALVGRVQEVKQIVASLRAARLVTLTGPGGVGKTRLAIAVAEETADDYSAGAFFVDLAALSDPALVPNAVASALELREEPDRPLPTTLLDYLKGRELLLILDNCEHLIEACARLVDDLLGGCAQLHILATSRQALGLTGEVGWPVPGLSLPASPAGDGNATGKEWLSLLSEYEAVQLFVVRAQQALPSFQMSGQNAGAVARICRRLEGMPLAIELAAARVKALTVEQIAVRLDAGFGLLTGGNRTALPRLQTLQATLDWSYNLLNEPERVLLGRLSVFAGGWSLEAAESVCAGQAIAASEVLDLLTSLVDKSLVVMEAQGAVSRYRLLETVRQYARDRLGESGEGDAVRERHQEFYLALTEEAESQLHGPEQGAWLHRLQEEHDNLRAALEWGHPEARLRIAGALWRFWDIRGYFTEGRERLAGALAGAEAQERTPARAKALHGAGALAHFQCDYAAARSLVEESLALSRELGDQAGIAGSLHSLGLLAASQRDLAAARRLVEESLALFRELRDKRGIAYALNSLGSFADEQDDNALALKLHEESLALKRELGDKGGIAYSLLNLGLSATAHVQCDYEAARPLVEESLALFRELGDKMGIVYSLTSLGHIAFDQNDYTAARPSVEESLALRRELGDKGGIALDTFRLGVMAYNQNEYAAAQALLEESLALRRKLGHKRASAESLHHLGIVARNQGDYGTAGALLEESLALYQELGDKYGIAVELHHLGLLAWHQGDYEIARTPLEESLAICRELGDKHAIAYRLFGLGLVAHAQGDYGTAKPLYEESLAIYREVRDKQGIAYALEAFACLAVAERQPERAVRLSGAAEALRQAGGCLLPPSEREEYDRNVVAAREALCEEAFAVAWAEGRAMSMEQAVEYALTDEHD